MILWAQKRERESSGGHWALLAAASSQKSPWILLSRASQFWRCLLGLQASRPPGLPASRLARRGSNIRCYESEHFSISRPLGFQSTTFDALKILLCVSQQPLCKWAEEGCAASLALCVPCFQKPPWKVTSPQKPLTASHQLPGASSILKVSFICLKKIPAWVCALIQPFRLMSPCWVPRGCTKAQTWGGPRLRGEMQEQGPHRKEGGKFQLNSIQFNSHGLRACSSGPWSRSAPSNRNRTGNTQVI